MGKLHTIPVLLFAASLLLLACSSAPPATTPKTNEVTTEEKGEQKSPLEQPQTSASTQPAASPWSMFHGNLRRTGLSPYDTSHVDGTVKWTFETGAGIESSPAIGSDGTIYFGSHDNKLYAINPDGTEKWRFNAGEPVYSKEWNVWKGILSSPAIGNDGTIYFTSLSNFLFAVSPDGTEKWRYPVHVFVNVWSSPVIGTDGTIYVGSESYPPGKTPKVEFGGRFYAINPDGTEKWHYDSGSAGMNASPAIGKDGIIYTAGGDWDETRNTFVNAVFAFNPDGTIKWRFRPDAVIEGSPTIGEDGTIYIGTKNGKFYALNLEGKVKWIFKAGDGISALAAIGKDKTIYIGSWDSYMYALNPDGTEKWRFETPPAFEGVSSSVAIGAEGTIYFGTNSGNFYALNPDGTKKWKLGTRGAGIGTSPAIGKDGTIYFGTWDHKLYAIGGSPSREGSEGTTTEKPKATFPSGGPEPIFTVSPVDIDRIDFIIPLGNLNPPAHVFPTDHMYFFMTGQMRSARLYAPGDLIVTSITAQEFINASFTDYTVTLKASDDITVEFGHVNSLSEDIFGDTATYEDWSLSNEYSTGGETYRLWTKNVEIKVTTGEVLGTVGKNRWGNWDFYLFDQRYRPENVANPARWRKRRSLNAVSFLSYYEKGPVLDQLVALVKRDKAAGDTTPYGAVMQDVPGTGQGIWFLPGVDDSSPEDPHLALVHSNIHPDRAVLSVGNSILTIDSGFYEFLPQNQGLLNRDFSGITPDGQIYAFQISEQYGNGFDGIIIVTMPNSETLWIEGRRGATTSPTSWAFTENKTIFLR